MASQFKYVIVGAGLAGASAVEGIREHDTSGSIALIGKEDRLPYDRPPLTKGLWLGKTKLDEIPVHDEEFYRSRGVHVVLNSEVVSIDPRKKQVAGKDRSHYSFEKLLLATGGTPRTLSFGADAVHYYRTVDDYLWLKEATQESNEFVIIGGGFIGGELAAALTLNGKKVTMVFPDQYLLQRIFPANVAKFMTESFRAKGVTVLSGELPVAIERSGGRVHVTTKSGTTLTGQRAVGAIGLNLHTEMAKRAGLKVENGVSVNSFLQTSDPNIYAAGDIAYFPAQSLEKSIRIEHWDNARAQGKHAGTNMAGTNKPFTYLPYFWSDLFEFGFEAIGELDSTLQIFQDWKEEFREGVIYYVGDGKVRGVLLWNVWGKVDAARNLIDRGKVYRNAADLKGRL